MKWRCSSTTKAGDEQHGTTPPHVVSQSGQHILNEGIALLIEQFHCDVFNQGNPMTQLRLVALLCQTCCPESTCGDDFLGRFFRCVMTKDLRCRPLEGRRCNVARQM